MMAKTKATKESKFTKEQAYESKKYRDKKDLVNALLEDGKSYTIKEIDGLIDRYFKKDLSKRRND